MFQVKYASKVQKWSMPECLANNKLTWPCRRFQKLMMLSTARIRVMSNNPNQPPIARNQILYQKKWTVTTCTICKTKVPCSAWMLSMGCIGSFDNWVEQMHFMICLRQTFLDSKTQASNVLAAQSANALEAVVVLRRFWVNAPVSCCFAPVSSLSKNMLKLNWGWYFDASPEDMCDKFRAPSVPGLKRLIMHFAEEAKTVSAQSKYSQGMQQQDGRNLPRASLSALIKAKWGLSKRVRPEVLLCCVSESDHDRR